MQSLGELYRASCSACVIFQRSRLLGFRLRKVCKLKKVRSTHTDQLRRILQRFALPDKVMATSDSQGNRQPSLWSGMLNRSWTRATSCADGIIATPKTE